MSKISSNSKSPRRVLSLFDSMCIIVGTIIGSGIFEIPGRVASNLGSVVWVIGIWVIGGAIAMIGSLCFAELSTKYPEPGGDYAYLKRGYNRRVAFAFSWAAFWIIRPGNIGAMAMIFGIHANQLYKLPGDWGVLIYALIVVIWLSGTNLIGIRFGKTTQNVLTVAKVVGILLIVSAAFLIPDRNQNQSSKTNQPELVAVAPDLQTGQDDSSENANREPDVSGNQVDPENEKRAIGPTTTWSSFWLVMVFVMFAYGGWNDIAFVAAEVERPQVNLLRSLLLGTGVVIAVYLLVNLALLVGLGFAEFAGAGGEATKLIVKNKMGSVGSQLLAALVCASCAGAINGMIFTSPRIYWATAIDYPKLRWLAGASDSNHPGDSGWSRAMILQLIVTVGLMILCGFTADGFDTILISTAIYFWFFLGLTVISLIICRYRYDQTKREGFCVPLYPVLPILFTAACFFMVYRSWDWMVFNKLWLLTCSIAGLMIVGVGLSFLLGNENKDDEK